MLLVKLQKHNSHVTSGNMDVFHADSTVLTEVSQSQIIQIYIMKPY